MFMSASPYLRRGLIEPDENEASTGAAFFPGGCEGPVDMFTDEDVRSPSPPLVAGMANPNGRDPVFGRVPEESEKTPEIEVNDLGRPVVSTRKYHLRRTKVEESACGRVTTTIRVSIDENTMRMMAERFDMVQREGNWRY